MTPRRLISILFMASAVLLTAQTLCAQNVSDKQARKDRLEKEIAILDKQIRINSSKNADALARLSLLQSKIKARQSLVDESNRELDAINGRIAAKQKEIDLRQARLDTMTAYSGRLIRSAYKNRDTRVWYIYILASESVSQGLRRAAFFRNLSSTMAAQAAKIKAEKAGLEKEKAALDALAAEGSKCSTNQCAEIYTDMIVEVFILNGDSSLIHVWRDIVAINYETIVLTTGIAP